jgi:hypothetical protein
MKDVMLTKPFYPRKNLSEICTEKKAVLINKYNFNQKTKNSSEIYLRLNEEFDKNCQSYYLNNERNKEIFIKEQINESFLVYKVNMNEILNHFCLKPRRFDEITEESKDKANKHLRKYFCDDNEIEENYSLTVRNF